MDEDMKRELVLKKIRQAENLLTNAHLFMITVKEIPEEISDIVQNALLKLFEHANTI